MPAVVKSVGSDGRVYTSDPSKKTISKLVNTLGTADGTIADPTATYGAPAQAILLGNFRDVTNKLDEVIDAMKAKNVAF